MRRTPNPLLATAFLSIVAIAVYLGLRGLSAPTPTSLPAATGATMPPTLVESLPDFELENLEGMPVSIQSWPGKPLIVNFWATWCAPCLREIPMLKAYQSDHPSVQVVGIAIDRVEPVRAFAEDMQFNYPVLAGPAAMDAAGAFGVDYVALPLTVFVGKDGRVLSAHMGELHAEHLENLTSVLEALEAGSMNNDEARARLDMRM